MVTTGEEMRRLAPAIGVGLVMTATAATAESRIERSLRQLAPRERLVQLCDYTAMKRIRRENRKFRPDRAVADAIVETRISDDTVHAAGGAFRSRGKWYALFYTCKASPETLKVQSFTYKIGDEIPESKWAAYGLWQ
jgi:hypothetical protein